MQESFATRRYGPYELSFVWPQPSIEDQASVKALWDAHGAIPADSSTAAEARARQLLVVAKVSGGSEVAAVSTAAATEIPRLGFPCFYYRTFVGASHRKLWALSEQLLNLSYHGLNQRFQAGHDPEVLGLFFNVENDRLLHLTQAAWKLEGFDAVYVGRNEQGHHARVCYFDRARIP